MAAILLQSQKVSLYQTVMFVQSNIEGIPKGTSWHRDLSMIPLDTAHIGHLTFWCPLQDLSSDNYDSILTFGMGSHRDVTYSTWYPTPLSTDQVQKILVDRYKFGRMSDMKIRDCTAHHGWTYHSAPPQKNGTRCIA